MPRTAAPAGERITEIARDVLADLQARDVADRETVPLGACAGVAVQIVRQHAVAGHRLGILLGTRRQPRIDRLRRQAPLCPYGVVPLEHLLLERDRVTGHLSFVTRQ